MEIGSTSASAEDVAAAMIPAVPGQAELEAYLSVPVTDVAAWTRAECPACNGKRRFYCSTCLKWSGAPADTTTPRLQLPIQICCILADYRKKATGIHAAVICPDTVTVHEVPDIPEFDPATTLAVFPSSDAVTLEEVEDLEGIERLVLIDSRWNNTTKVLDLPVVRNLRKVKLRHPPVFSRFWRYHTEGVGHISTIEALYYIVHEYQAASGRVTQRGPLTDLLYLFRLQLRVIEDAYDNHPDLDGRPRPTQAEGKIRRLERQCPGSKKLKKYKSQLAEIGMKEGGGEGGGEKRGRSRKERREAAGRGKEGEGGGGGEGEGEGAGEGEGKEEGEKPVS